MEVTDVYFFELTTFSHLKAHFQPRSFFIYEKYAIFLVVVESLLYLLPSSYLVLSKFHPKSCKNKLL